MTEQVRLWFYSMLFFSVTLEGVPPYKTVVTHAEVRDEKSERMSKTKHNGIPYEDAVSKMGVDAMRWMYCQQKPAANVNFGYNIADQVKREFFLILWNSYRFFTQHANNFNWTPKTHLDLTTLSNPLDRWIVSRLTSTSQKVTDTLDKYSTAAAARAIENFVTDLSTWYIRRSRERDDNLELIYEIFDRLTEIIAPFIPFLSEQIFQNLHPAETVPSVHLQDWPKPDEKLIDKNLEAQMAQVRNLCQQIHALRQTAAVKIRQPLSGATINVKLPEDMVNIIKEETNVKSVVIGKEITLDTKLTPGLIEEGEYRDFVRSVQILRRETGLLITDKIKIFAPSWPKNFEKEILSKALGVSIAKSDSLRIEKIS